MEIKDKLDKPYTEKQKCDFIVKNNHWLGYEIQETDEALLAVYNEPLPPTEEEQRENRARAYKEEVDHLMAEYNRKKTFNLFEEGEEEALLIEVEAKVEEIKQRYPYPEGENVGTSVWLHDGDVMENYKEVKAEDD